jgi:hypothetical protein
MNFLSRVATSRGVRTTICAVLLICVLSLVVSPNLNILPTVLRARSIAIFSLIPMVVLTLVFAVQSPPASRRLEFVFLHEESLQARASRLSLTCVWLC